MNTFNKKKLFSDSLSSLPNQLESQDHENMVIAYMGAPVPNESLVQKQLH